MTSGVVVSLAVPRPEPAAAPCGGRTEPARCVQAALKLLSGKWKAEILWALCGGRRRFGALRRAIPGITQHMLTTQLRELERHGLLTRTVHAEVPPRVEYELTPAAHDLQAVFAALRHWSERHGASLRLGPDGEREEPPRDRRRA